MRDQASSSLVEAAAHALTGAAVAVGAAIGDDTDFAWRGDLAGEPVHGQTVFYAASVTKQVIGIAVAQAVERGMIDVTDPVTRWLPELPGSMRPVRLDHLIHHTSDLPDVTDPATGVPTGNAEVIERFRRLETLSPRPGRRYAYNNAGYVLLAESLARSTDRTVAELAEDLFRQADLAKTRMGGPSRGARLEGRPDPPGTVGDGGWWTSICDLTRWLQACNAAAFGVEVQRWAESTATTADGSALDYAWGVRVGSSPAGRIITHGGSWDRWLAKTVRIPERQVAVAVLSVGAGEHDVSRTGTDLALAIAAR